MPWGPRARCRPLPLALALALFPACRGSDAGGSSLRVGALQQPPPAAKQKQASGDANKASEWQAEGQMAVARTRVLGVHAAAAQGRASSAAGDAAVVAQGVEVIEAEAAPAVVAANASLQQALAARDKAETLVEGVEQRAYAEAKAAAEETVGRLEKEAQAYFDAMLAEHRLLAGASGQQSNLRAKAAEAAKPYKEAGKHIQDLESQYSAQVQKLAEEATTLAGQASAATDAATVAQAQGNAPLAAQKTAEAHGLTLAAGERKAQALKIRQIVETLHSYIPGYQQAGKMASERVLAVGAP